MATRVKEKLTAAGFDVDLLEEFDDRLDGYQALALVSIHSDTCQFIDDNATGFKVAASSATDSPEKAGRLAACGIEAKRPVFRPLHRYLGHGGCPVADALHASVLSVPLYPALHRREVERVAAALSALDPSLLLAEG